MLAGKQNFIYAAAGLLLGFALIISQSDQKPKLSEQQAIGIIKAQFPELRSYPSTGLPPTSIITEQSPEGWHIAFVINGSGRPYISAECFLVRPDKTFSLIAVLGSEHANDKARLSPKDCKLQ